MLVELTEFYFFETSIVRDYFINELLQVVVKLLEELDRLHLPHLFDLNIVEKVSFEALHWCFMDTTLWLFGFDPSLEDNNEEFAAVGLWHLS